MKQIIKDTQIVGDDWSQLGEEDFGQINFDATGPKQILPLAAYIAYADRLAGAKGRVGILLEPDCAPEKALPYLDKVALVAIHFPSFTDGRGYSIGRLIRVRYGFSGELRAVGDILRDQLYFLNHCGFNAFELRHDQNLTEALEAFRDYAWQPTFLAQGHQP